MAERDINWAMQALLGARIIDDLLVRFGLYDKDSAVVDEALRYLAEAALVPGQPVSGCIRRVLEQRGLCEGRPSVPHYVTVVTDDDTDDLICVVLGDASAALAQYGAKDGAGYGVAAPDEMHARHQEVQAYLASQGFVLLDWVHAALTYEQVYGREHPINRWSHTHLRPDESSEDMSNEPRLPAGCVLKPRYQLVLAERAAGKTWRHIGEILGVSPSRAQQLAAEARAGLRRCYETAQEQEWQRRIRDLPQDAARALYSTRPQGPQDDGFDLGPVGWDDSS